MPSCSIYTRRPHFGGTRSSRGQVRQQLFIDRHQLMYQGIPMMPSGLRKRISLLDTIFGPNDSSWIPYRLYRRSLLHGNPSPT